jgi:hypothetical protein
LGQEVKLTSFQWVVIGFLSLLTIIVIGIGGFILYRTNQPQYAEAPTQKPVATNEPTRVSLPPIWTPTSQPLPVETSDISFSITIETDITSQSRSESNPSANIEYLDAIEPLIIDYTSQLDHQQSLIMMTDTNPNISSNPQWIRAMEDTANLIIQLGEEIRRISAPSRYISTQNEFVEATRDYNEAMSLMIRALYETNLNFANVLVGQASVFIEQGSIHMNRAYEILDKLN